MKVLVSGGTGLVGRYIVEGLLDAGYQVIVGGRTPPAPDFFSKPVEFAPLSLDPALDQIEAFDEAYFFVHAAFDHLPGKYRGGEGDDPGRFRWLNLDGTVKLFETARKAGTRRAVFLSSRAVYDGQPAGAVLDEDMVLEPGSLYGEIKLSAERALAHLSAPGFATSSLRLTGVYGNLRPNKWDALFSDYLAGRPVPSRAATEIHGRDVAAAVRLMLETETGKIAGQVFNASDILTDTREILSHLPARHLPPPAERGSVSLMSTDKLRAIGWQPGGADLLRQTVEDLARSFSATA
ncbi:NAD(P)-dependent oxidoreductase [Neorhizobium galegae]|uniref:NAD-dependent epimerase/dehydratase family protein n=2 Tax=Neorhizobium galegae TaxID=399 RepID=UPI0006219138|nr:NAD(P)-dependent oxidoreductase [Neorhizobium galegae]MCQ1779660.1 NAD(P)-dependent oxidoreductase [Neorhizobium galegae]CDZ28387.1 Sulfolipid biosynthesis protein [Neorhizobium galegae bv. officinalis]